MNSEAADQNTLYMKVQGIDGVIIVEMRPDIAPNHVKRIKELVAKGFYNGHTFHRVINGFMAQTGDPKGNGTGGSGTKISAEFSDEPFVRGAIGMARAASLDSADSQFFIMFSAHPHLNGQYTYWGKVIEGMDVVDKIKKGGGSGTNFKEGPSKIEEMWLAA